MKVVNFGVKSPEDVIVLLPRILIYSKVLKIEYISKSKSFKVEVGCQDSIELINEKNIKQWIAEINGEVSQTKEIVKCIIENGRSIPTVDYIMSGRCDVLLEETSTLWISKRMNAFVKEGEKYILVEVVMPPSGKYFTHKKAGSVNWGPYDLSTADVTKIKAVLNVIHEFYYPTPEIKEV